MFYLPIEVVDYLLVPTSFLFEEFFLSDWGSLTFFCDIVYVKSFLETEYSFGAYVHAVVTEDGFDIKLEFLCRETKNYALSRLLAYPHWEKQGDSFIKLAILLWDL